VITEESGKLQVRQVTSTKIQPTNNESSYTSLKFIFQPLSITVHPKYNLEPFKFDYDLALVLFKRPGFRLTPAVKPICLWNEDYLLSIIEGSYGKVKIKVLGNEHNLNALIGGRMERDSSRNGLESFIV
jgi:hypothetical protein